MVRARSLCWAAFLVLAISIVRAGGEVEEGEADWMSESKYAAAKRRLSASLAGNFGGAQPSPSPSPKTLSPGLAQTPGSYGDDHCATGTNADPTICASCSAATGCAACTAYSGLTANPWRILSDDDGASDFNTCRTCNIALGCPNPRMCTAGVGCTACGPGQYKRAVTVSNTAGSATYNGCSSCKEDFGCSSCDSSGCLCTNKRFWWVPAGRNGRQGSCKYCSDLAGPGCDVCYLTGECKTCKSPFILDSLSKKCKTCAQVAPRCDKCSSSGQCLKCQAGNFKDGNGMCKKCASVNPNCLKCVDGSSGACSQCSGGYTLNSSKKCIKKKTCQDVFGANCAYCSPSLGSCLACRVGYYYDAQAGECLSCKITFGKRCSFCSARSCYWG